MMRRPIFVVGSINLDLVCVSQRIPAPGETVRGNKFQTFNGGKGANQAVAVARLGHPVRMIAKIGDDEFGKRLRRGLRSEGVNTQTVTVAAGAASGVALISVDADGQNSITIVPGANDQLFPSDLEKCLPQLRCAGMIMTQLEIPMATVEYLCATARDLRIPLMLDPAPARALPSELLESVTYLTPNETEMCALCGISTHELSLTAVRRYAESLQGAANVIVKMGDKGAYVSGADGMRQLIPAFTVTAVDSTAAGDAFNAGLAVALLRGAPLAQAVRYGNAAGALAATRAGAQTAMPTPVEVSELLKSGAGPTLASEENLASK